jgi:hypothetical protein
MALCYPTVQIASKEWIMLTKCEISGIFLIRPPFHSFNCPIFLRERLITPQKLGGA